MNRVERRLTAIAVVVSVVVLGLGFWFTRAWVLAHQALPPGQGTEGVGVLLLLAPAAASLVVVAVLLGGVLPGTVRGLRDRAARRATADVAELSRR
ncbi:hypothetical protein C8046_06885 [Serinibacter arcticus]|uniref:Uncharacterized protein n=1 Tax=Serinibacter arcticus TaxID=1655435 RepID=A0A2U1ZTV2_9MICO|nr:hypothetical protein [Serinibacter arcticus]PWD50414.1 hypothetical protein C8046_06885 [Serinibacter arcticus]